MRQADADGRKGNTRPGRPAREQLPSPVGAAASALRGAGRRNFAWPRAVGWSVSVTEICETAEHQAQALITGAGRRIGRAAAEKPLSLIAAVAGTAFAAGVLLRVWRSSRYE
jgi:hypothetical protein